MSLMVITVVFKSFEITNYVDIVVYVNLIVSHTHSFSSPCMFYYTKINVIAHACIYS